MVLSPFRDRLQNKAGTLAKMRTVFRYLDAFSEALAPLLSFCTTEEYVEEEFSEASVSRILSDLPGV